MTMRRVHALLCLAVSLCLAVVAPAGAAPEKASVRIAVGGKATLYYLPLTLAERLGYFRDEGLEVEVVDFPGGAKALQAVVGGSADIVSGGFEHTIQMQAKGQKMQAFVLQGNAALALGLVKGRIDAYQGPKDLAGRKIGVTAPGSSTHTLLNHLLASAQLKPGDVSVVGVGTGATAVAAARSGQIDAIVNVEPSIVMLERAGDIRIAHETFSEAGSRLVYGGVLPSACLYAKIDFVRANPRTVQALTNAMVRALRWLQAASNDDVLKTIPPEYALGDRAAYTAALTRLRGVYSKDGVIPPAGAELSLKITAEDDPSVRGANIALDQIYTNAFTQKVPAR
jgi:NitT/TauT family transport system substrate-binding protein